MGTEFIQKYKLNLTILKNLHYKSSVYISTHIN